MNLDLNLNPQPLYDFAGEVSKNVDYGAWDNSLKSQLASLEQLCDLQGPATPEQRDCILCQLVALQQPDGSFSLALGYQEGMDFDEVDIMEDDVVDYVFKPTYLVCQILMRAVLDGADFPGLDDCICRGLEFACERRLQGSSDSYEGAFCEQIATYRDFARVGFAEYFARDPELCIEFAQMLNELTDEYLVMLDRAGTFYGEAFDGFTSALLGALEEGKRELFGRDNPFAVFHVIE